jgi:S1-C subfamily serine protease
MINDNSDIPDRTPTPTPIVAVARRSRGLPAWGLFVVAALIAGMLSGMLGAVAMFNLLAPSPAGANSSAPGTLASSLRVDETSAVTGAVQKTSPAVVVIQTSVENGFGRSGTGIGSGMIYDANGWILTNKHVIDGASQIQVRLADSRTFTGSVYGTDPLTDLAIVKIDATGLPTVQIGTSDGLVIGQLAIAIGDPLGTFENTVTTGVVSGLGRQIQAGDSTGLSGEQLNNLILTDAAINPGNSGGPLLNSAGQVIGVNTAVAGSAQGIGFAIPIDVAKPIMQQALDGKQLTRPWIGVYYQPVTKQLAVDRKLSVDQGALVDASADVGDPVVAGGPADKAGLKAGDVIVAVDGAKVDATHDLSTRILPHSPGDEITLTIVRDGSQQMLRVTLGTLPASR